MNELIERKIESSLEQANVLKSFCDWRDFDKLKITQFADFIIVMPKDKTIDEFLRYWKIYTTDNIMSDAL